MLTLQGLLFAAVGFSWRASPELSFSISIAGTVATLVIAPYFSEPSHAIKKVRGWWDQRLADGASYDGPPIFGMLDEDHNKFLFFKNSTSPLYFALGMVWGAILAASIRQLVTA